MLGTALLTQIFTSTFYEIFGRYLIYLLLVIINPGGNSLISNDNNQTLNHNEIQYLGLFR